MIICDNTGKIVSWRDVKKANPNVSLPKEPTLEFVNSLGYNEVTVSDKPELELNKSFVKNSYASLVNGSWIIDWTAKDLIVYPTQVKAEAGRRIIVLCPDWKQRNMIIRYAELLSKPLESLSVLEQSELEEIQKVFAEIVNLRNKSDDLELMNPIPSDYRDDKYWT